MMTQSLIPILKLVTIIILMIDKARDSEIIVEIADLGIITSHPRIRIQIEEESRDMESQSINNSQWL